MRSHAHIFRVSLYYLYILSLKPEMSPEWSPKNGSHCLPKIDCIGKTCQTKIKSASNAKRWPTLDLGRSRLAKTQELQNAPVLVGEYMPKLVCVCCLLLYFCVLWKGLFSHDCCMSICLSAFFDFGNSRRAEFRKMYPTASNGEISSMLAKVWKEAPAEIKKEYVEREARLREQYKRDIAAWTEACKRGTLPLSSPEDADNSIMEDGDDQIEEYGEYCLQQVLVKSQSDDPENDKKPPAVEGYSKRQDHKTQSNVAGHMEERLEGRYRAPTFADFPQQQEQPVDAHEHSIDTTSHQWPKYAAAARKNTKDGSDTSFSSDEKSLAPLTSSDIGGFLAAAAMLDAGPPDQGNVHSIQQDEANDYECGAKSSTSTATGAVARDRPMTFGVRKVVSQLPPESMKDEDLPKIPTPP
jgi:hypothetical protein